MASSPLLTVLVVAYNHETTIAESLDSVLSQKTKHPYIIWIAEDCSSDGTLAICKDYAKKYPKQIKLFSQPSNTKGRHFGKLLSEISTKYLAHLDGDDYWCDTSKIQMALDTLERNPEYVTFAHDTLYSDASTKEKKSLMHAIQNSKLRNPVSIYEAPYIHASARLHRRTPSFKEHFATFRNAGDIFMFYYFLDQGPLYYYDKVMSVYNINGRGSWSKLTTKEQAFASELGNYRVNSMLGYRHDKFFSQKVSNPKLLIRLKSKLGVRVGWKAYMTISRIQNKG